jgi:hypothetical protein
VELENLDDQGPRLTTISHRQDFPDPQVFFPGREDQRDDISHNLSHLDGHRRDV